MTKRPFDETAARLMKTVRESLLGYLIFMHPNLVIAPHLYLICKFLEEMYKGNVTHGMTFMPPRSSKSFTASQNFPAWELGLSPNWHFIVLSHSAALADDFSREVRNQISSDAYQFIFPETSLRPDSRAANRWHTNKNGVYISSGVTGQIAGRGFNQAILDDPLSEQTAFSKAEREHVNRIYASGIRSRQMSNSRILIQNTRWHENDLCGHLLRLARQVADADQWDILSIPAICTEESAYQLNGAREALLELDLIPDTYPIFEEGASYWPPTPGVDRKSVILGGWTTEELLRTKANMPTSDWEAVYMQRPVADQGNILKRNYWQEWEGEPPECEYVIMSLDTSYGESTESDYTAMHRYGIFKGSNGSHNIILLGAKKGRWEYPELRRMVWSEHQTHNPDIILIEKKASGQSLIQDLRQANLPVLEYQPDKDKTARAYACTPILEAKRVWVPQNRKWADEVINECASFPSGEYDDHVDAFTQAILWFRQGMWVSHPDDALLDQPATYRNLKRIYG